MLTLKITYENGDFTISKFNGTLELAKAYYEGSQKVYLNGGLEVKTKVIAVEETAPKGTTIN